MGLTPEEIIARATREIMNDIEVSMFYGPGVATRQLRLSKFLKKLGMVAMLNYGLDSVLSQPIASSGGPRRLSERGGK